MNRQVSLSRLLYEESITIEDIAAFIAIQFRMEQARIKIVDMDPVRGEIEIGWDDGMKEWFLLPYACDYILEQIEAAEYSERKEAQDAPERGHKDRLR